MKPLKPIYSDKFMNFVNSTFKTNFDAYFLFPFTILKTGLSKKTNKEMINHESTHFYQCIETLIVGFYLIYYVHYLYNRIKGMNDYDAYRNVIFEKEAYLNTKKRNYLKERKWYGWANFNNIK